MKQNFTKRGGLKAIGLLFILTLLFGVQSMYAQSTINGTISDAEGPLAGASVVAKGTTTGAVADFDGNYTITVPEGAAALVFSYVGLCQSGSCY